MSSPHDLFWQRRFLCNNAVWYRSGKRESIRIFAITSPSVTVANLAVLAAVSMAFGCTTLDFGIRERAENAFRRQNELSGAFMLAAPEMESKFPGLYESLLLKEELMLDACLPFNTLAAKRRDDELADFDEKKAILDSLQSCEQATVEFDEILQPALRQTTEL